MKKSKKRRHLLTWAGEESINLTPLLDVIFNLIFFFLLATTLRQTKALLDVRLPQANQAAIKSIQKKTLVITLNSEDRILLGDIEMTLDTLEEELKNIKASDIQYLILKGDAMAHHESVVKILDVCSKAGHKGISIEVKPSKVQKD